MFVILANILASYLHSLQHKHSPDVQQAWNHGRLSVGLQISVLTSPDIYFHNDVGEETPQVTDDVYMIPTEASVAVHPIRD